MVELTYLSEKKLLFLFVFSTYLLFFLLKFRLRELIGCGIRLHIQRVPTQNTFYGPHYPKNKKYSKKRDYDIIITFFQVFLVFGVARPVKSMPSGCWLDVEFNSHPMSSPNQNLSKNKGRYVENKNKK